MSATMDTTKVIRRIPASCATTKLERAARKWINEQAREYDSGCAGALRDLFQGGCASGIVGDLIYYTDTMAFYRRHRDELGKMLADSCEQNGMQPSEIIRGWDKSDPLAQEVQNQNVLAWFGFEEAARIVAQRAGLEV